jgi:hypothetical protein
VVEVGRAGDAAAHGRNPSMILVENREMDSSGEGRKGLRVCLTSDFGKRSLLSSEPYFCLGELLFELTGSDSVGEEVVHHCPHPDLYGG